MRLPVVDRRLFDADALDRELAGDSAPLERFRRALREADHTLRERFLSGRTASELVPARAAVLDRILIRAWRLFFDPAAPHLALVAVGGYGRGELHPGSDVDLLILLAESDDAPREAIEGFLTFVWDMGLEVGHSVRSVSQCAEEAARDITVATNLQEARLLVGPPALFDAQRERCGPAHVWPSRAFFSAKLEEQIARHHKYHDTAYNLEPNIKEGPGGLRDIQMIGWVAKRHFGAEDLHDLVAHGFLTEKEYRTLTEGQAFLWQIRFGLHLLAGRREDRLLFDHQRSLARQFGYRDDPKRLGVEHFMKQYYRVVMELGRLNEMLLQLFQEEILYADDTGEPVPINKRFQARKGFLEAVDERVFRRYPFALLEVFFLLAQHRELKGVRANTIRLIRDHRPLIDNEFRDDLRCRTLFMELLRQPQGVTHELRRMNRYGVLGAYLPAFGQIVGQMQHDLFHVYTVDEHTLAVVRNLRRFTVPAYRQEFPLCSSVIARVPKPELLYIAALFHDIAKGRGGDHSELGARDALEFALRHGLSTYDANLVAWLVRKHLMMSMTAQRRDISDPLVVNVFAQEVGEKSRLDYLYLLTVADMRGTSPNVWNAWKDALLRELYHATVRALRRGLATPLLQSERIAEVQNQARVQLIRARLDPQALEQLWADLGEEYFLRYSPDEVSWHSEAILTCPPQDRPLILSRQDASHGATEVFIYAPSRNHLFAKAASVIDQMGMTVQDARIIRSDDGHALDTFVILEESGEPISDAGRMQELLHRLREQVLDEAPGLPTVSRHLPRQRRHFAFAPEVSFSEEIRNQRTIMEVAAFDRPGLLAQIGAALAECGVRLHNAKIATFGERAEDIFYITDEHDRALSDPAQFDCVRERVLRYLSEGAPEPAPAVSRAR